jgi:hypothetical protein
MSTVDYTQLFTAAKNIAESGKPVLIALGACLGLFFVFRAGVILATGSKNAQQDMPWGKLVTNLVIAAFLLSFTRTLAIVDETLAGAGEDWRSALGGAAPSGGGAWGIFMQAALAWVAFLGMSAVFRGFLLWHKLGSGDNQNGGDDLFWRGLWHILFGGIAINIGTS